MLIDLKDISVARLILCFAGMLLLFMLAGTAPLFAAERVALVIGNGIYQKVPTLPNPPHDAADIGKALERLNFRVTQLSNATAVEMRKAIVDFGRSTEGAEMAVIFYAGHGMEVSGENWLIPTDAELRSDTDMESEAISLRSINLQVSKAHQLGLVILDACRNNPFAAKMERSISTRAVARGLAPTEPSDNVLIAYAARDGTTASDGDSRNSPFTTALLRHIETPGLEISFLFRNVRDEVMSATQREQQPFVYGSLSKEAIYLKSLPASASPKAPAPAEASAPKAESPKDSRSQNPNDIAEQKSNSYTRDDAQRVAAMGTEHKLKMPPFSIGTTKSDVPNSYRQFVGVWSSKVGSSGGKGRQAMLIVTEAYSDGLVLGFYLYGPPTKYSWEKDIPAGYTALLGRVSDGTLRFKSGSTSIEAKLVGTNAMTLQSTNPRKRSQTSTVNLAPIWQLAPPRLRGVRKTSQGSRRKYASSGTCSRIIHQEPVLFGQRQTILPVTTDLFRIQRMSFRLLDLNIDPHSRNSLAGFPFAVSFDADNKCV